jgi:hypothetical protein
MDIKSKLSGFNIADAQPNELLHARCGIHLWIAALIVCQASEMSGFFEVVCSAQLDWAFLGPAWSPWIVSQMRLRNQAAAKEVRWSCERSARRSEAGTMSGQDDSNKCSVVMRVDGIRYSH